MPNGGGGAMKRQDRTSGRQERIAKRAPRPHGCSYPPQRDLFWLPRERDSIFVGLEVSPRPGADTDSSGQQAMGGCERGWLGFGSNHSG